MNDPQAIAAPAAPRTIVLQPNGSLDCQTMSRFQQLLDASLSTAEAVIVDLIWVEATDEQAITVLAAGVQRAIALGKTLSFQSMPFRLRTAIEAECQRLRAQTLGVWQDTFAQELETFLDSWASV